MNPQVPASDSNAAERLWQDIEDSMTTRQFDNATCGYLHSSDIDTLASLSNIRDVVGGDITLPYDQKPFLSKWIRENGQRMFIICVYASIPMRCLWFFRGQGATDTSIPWTNEIFARATGTFSDAADRFRQFQHIFPQPFTLAAEPSHYSSIGVPIEFGGRLLGSGVTGTVYTARLDMDYCRVPGVTADPNQAGLTREVAIKKYALGGKAQEHANRELLFAATLATDRPHKHIMKSYAACTVHTQGQPGIQPKSFCYLISELAWKSLSGLMLNDAIPAQKTTQGEAWVRQQILGLARALELIHSSQDGLIGVHHDIKPENILVCGKNLTLKLTDWGCASFNAPELTTSSSPKSLPRGNFPYLPPENVLDQNSTIPPTSRPHDIWALGCVFTEILVWLTEGINGHDDFALRVYQQGEHDCWFIGRDDTLDLSAVLKAKLILLEQSKWRNLVSIIRKMFEIDTQDRITAQNLVIALDDPQNPI